MTDREKAIVMAYTGVCMLAGDKLSIFYKYVKEIMGRPIYTHEMAIKAIDDEIKEKAKADFIALCAEQEPILDKIRAEIESLRKEAANKNYEDVKLLNYYFGLNDGLEDARDIIDEYRARAERNDNT